MNSSDQADKYTLESALSDLRREYAAEEPSGHVPVTLLHANRRIRTQRRLRLWSAAAAALALMLTAWGLRPTRPAAVVSARVPVPVTVTAVRTPSPRITSTDVQRRVSVNLREAQGRSRSPRRRRVLPQIATHQDAPQNDPFFAIPYAPPILETDRIDVYRVKMASAAAASYGVPLQSGSLGSTVTADLVVGSDGIARAVRFVH